MTSDSGEGAEHGDGTVTAADRVFGWSNMFVRPDEDPRGDGGWTGELETLAGFLRDSPASPPASSKRWPLCSDAFPPRPAARFSVATLPFRGAEPGSRGCTRWRTPSFRLPRQR